MRDFRKWELQQSLILKSDQEDAIKDLVNELINRRSADLSLQKAGITSSRLFNEESPVADSQGNGFIESAVKSLEGIVRTLKFALEDRIGRRIGVSEPLFAWLVEHGADLLTKY